MYGFLWIIQASLIFHILCHPYISGRQFRLELWSLVAILLTVGLSLFIPSIGETETLLAISMILFLVNLGVIFIFLFYIGRGLARRFATNAWRKVTNCWKKISKENKIEGINFEISLQFLKDFAQSNEKDQKQYLEEMEKWWKQAPNYKRRRMMQQFAILAKGTSFANFAGHPIKLPETESKRNSLDLSNSNLVDLPEPDL